MDRYLHFTFAVALLASTAMADTLDEHVQVGADGVQHVSIVGGSYFFKPNHIVVKAGLPIELSVRMEAGLIPHRFVLKIPANQIDIDSPLNQNPHTFHFTLTAAGRYAFYCPNKLLFFPSHREKGMEGVLEVVE